jgi:predicted TIM-barrel fold metal-dependent hydrolase
MILDGHTHIYAPKKGRPRRNPSEFMERLGQAGVDGGVVVSIAPPTFKAYGDPVKASARLDDVLDACEAGEHLYSFFWIDPMEPDAFEQVDEAVERGIRGFKVICHAYEPGAPRAMEVFGRIAAKNRPILFHSGILWDSTASSQYNRPVLFEPLIELDGLRFALAHIGWPWTDESIAVYGKFDESRRGRHSTAEMFVDTTPGTPPVYRRDALTKLFTAGAGPGGLVLFRVENNVLFGTDRSVNAYRADGVRHLIAQDREIFGEIGLDEDTQEAYFSRNLLRFVGEEAG